MARSRVLTGVLTEGNVSKRVLSFAGGEFLYTALVCKSWRQNYGETTTSTNMLNALQSSSTAKEAIEAGVNTLGLLDLAVIFCAKVEVLLQLSRMGLSDCHSCTRYYAAYTGNLEAFRLLCRDQYCDECDIFEAVRGGHLDVVKYAVGNMLPPAEDAAVNDMPKWRTSVYDNAFIRRCMAIANSSGKPGVAEVLHTYVEDRYFRPVEGQMLSPVDLAIAKGSLAMVRVLHEAGGRFSMDVSLRLAVNAKHTDIVRYLETEGAITKGGLLSNYLLTPFSFAYVEYLLKNKCAIIDIRALDRVLDSRNSSVFELLLKFGAPVTSSLVDRAIAEWDFGRARSLIASHGVLPTSKAYLWLFTQGMDADLWISCDTEDLRLDFDDVYLEGLYLIYFASGCELSLGFETFDDMVQTHPWHSLFQCLSSKVVQWFSDRLPHKMEFEG